jgi:hypothetical protein
MVATPFAITFLLPVKLLPARRKVTPVNGDIITLPAPVLLTTPIIAGVGSAMFVTVWIVYVCPVALVWYTRFDASVIAN